MDDLSPVNAEWEPGEHHNAIFIPNINYFTMVVLSNHNRLVIRYSSSGRTETTSFDIHGLNDVLKDVSKNLNKL